MLNRAIVSGQMEWRMGPDLTKKARPMGLRHAWTHPITTSGLPLDKGEDSMVEALRPLFSIGRCLGFPFRQKFHWYSLRSGWLVLSLIYSTTLTILIVKDILTTSASFGNVTSLVWYLWVTTYIYYFIWLSLGWAELEAAWLRVEAKMSGLPRSGVSRSALILAVLYVSLGLFEHSLSILENLRQVKANCKDSKLTTMELYYRVHYSVLFKRGDYALWKGLFTSGVILGLTVLWTFSDLFAATLAMVLAASFQQLRLALKEVQDKEMSVEFWRHKRVLYLELSALTKRLDDKISLLMFLTIGNNVFSIISMLLNALSEGMSVKAGKDFLQITYYILSFSFNILRLAGTCLTAARVAAHSRALLSLLFTVPTASYCLEVHRFVMQVWFEPVALTAFNFFSITKSTILKIAGSVVTYEIVLVQFGLLVNDDQRKAKIVCPI